MERARFIEVEAGVRYWDDAILDGQEDTEGTIPLRRGDLWCPIIDLKTGRVSGWPEGRTARIHYKVCDAGRYWLQDVEGRRIAKWRGFYVPSDFLCVGDRGFGDYIIFSIEADGVIKDWSEPSIDPDDWKAI